METDVILSGLPGEPRAGMTAWALKELDDELGGHLLIYGRERWYPGIDDEIGWPLAEEEQKTTWAARCKCSACGGEWFSGWLGGDPGGIAILQGEDGCTYHGVPGRDTPGTEFLEVRERECAACPWCETSLTATPKRKLRNGRTYQIMAGSIENIPAAAPPSPSRGEMAGNIEGYTALVAWLVTRRFSDWGSDDTTLQPVFAVVIDENGGLRGFSRAKYDMCGHVWPGGEWRVQKTLSDPFQHRYYSWEAVNSTKVGGQMWADVPEQLGWTGEKTGLADYVRDGGAYPFLYLRFRQRFPNVENLVKAGWTDTIDSFIQREADRALENGGKLAYPGDLENMARWGAARPSDMLCMTKAEAKRGSEWKWSMEICMLWRNFVDYGGFGCISLPQRGRDIQKQDCGRGDAAELSRLLKVYGLAKLEEFIACVGEEHWDWNIMEFDKYLARQERRFGLRRRDGLQQLMDYRIVLRRMVDAPTEAELWPPNLRAAHDRMARAEEAANAAKYIRGFGKIRETWGALEWSDGAICALLPRMNADLVDEGRTLHHCVGGYGQSHVNGKLIVFIRHARRPERSWFTLNVDVSGPSWKEIQLHGYGNEYAHGKRLHIPTEVRAFVDRWEREVLTPAFRAVRAKGRGGTRREVSA